MKPTFTHGIGGSEQRPYFARMPAEIVPGKVPSLPLPKQLCDIYRSGDGELYCGNLTFLAPKTVLAYNEYMHSRQQFRLVAFAYKYKGNGHISLHAYDPVTHVVLTMRDGGASPIERLTNTERRANLKVVQSDGLPFEVWWAEQVERIS